MDFVRSYFDKSADLEKKWEQKCLTGQRFICTEVTSYKIHILIYILCHLLALINMVKSWSRRTFFFSHITTAITSAFSPMFWFTIFSTMTLVSNLICYWTFTFTCFWIETLLWKNKKGCVYPNTVQSLFSDTFGLLKTVTKSHNVTKLNAFI